MLKLLLSAAVYHVIALASESNENIGKKQLLTIATVTDVHIGEGCGGNLSYEKCKPVRALTDAVDKINSMADIDGVFVTGDLTASALFEEFSRARSILDGLTVPWWPLLGNHDSWPYTKHSDGSFNQTDSPIGDEYFATIFGDILNNSKTSNPKSTSVSKWPGKATLNGDYQTYNSWFHNFVVTFPDFSDKFDILALDWVSRGAALPYAGVGPEVELHDFEGGTMDWLRTTLAEKQSEANMNFFLMQHHPFHNRDSLDPLGHNIAFNFTFDNNQDKSVEQLLSEYFPPSAYIGSQAGHNHRWFNGTAFTRFTALSNEWMQMPAFETPACKGWYVDEDYVSSIQFFRFAKQPQTEQVMLSNVFGMWKTPDGVWQRKPV